jgi:uncharacterized protein (DUF1501 family)
MKELDLTRRSFLAGSVASGMAVTAGLSPRALGCQAAKKTKRIVVIAFAGGVRTRETFGMPENVPNMKAMASDGVLYPRARTSNLGHYGAALTLFTGISEGRGIRENARGTDPTLFEYLRKDLALPQSEVWITTSGGAQQVNYSYGLHPDYGPQYGANTLDGDGIFNKEFRKLIASFGRPRQMEGSESRLLARLRACSAGGSGVEGAESIERVENYILDELTSGTSEISGANAGDAKALRLARNLLSVFKPRVIGVVLQNADIAHGSYNGYVEVVRRNDAAIGELWTAVKRDRELADSTAFFVLPEFGRDHDLNSRRGLDHGDGSDDLNYVACLAWGPEFKRGAVVEDEVRTIDVTPTVCKLLGAEAKFARGKVLPGLMG